MNSISSSNTPQVHDLYNHAPSQMRDPLMAAFQLFFWIIFHPSAWRNHLCKIDPKIKPNFRLIELDWADLQNPKLRRTLMIGFVGWPILISLLVSFILFIGGSPTTEVAIGAGSAFALGLFGGFGLGMLVEVALGIACGAALALLTGIAVGQAGGLLDNATGVLDGYANLPGGLYVMLSASLAVSLASNISVNIENRTINFSILRQVGGAVVAIFIAGLIVAIYGWSIEIGRPLLSSDPQNELPKVGISGVLLGLVAGLIVVLTIAMAWRWRTENGKSRLRAGIVAAIFFGISYGVGNGFGLALYGMSESFFPASLAYGAMAGIVLAVFSGAMFAVPYGLADRLGGPWAAAAAGALGCGGGWLALFALKGEANLWVALPLCLAAILIGISFAFWRPVLLYPFLAAWNTIIYNFEERRKEKQVSLLRLHSAVWDENQYLPLLGLDDHLVLVFERYPAESQAAIEHLSAGRQRSAVNKALTQVDIRKMRRCRQIREICQVHRTLAFGEQGGAGAEWFRGFGLISRDVETALSQESNYTRRFYLAEVLSRIDRISQALVRSGDRYAQQFQSIASEWRALIATHFDQLAGELEERQEIDSPYIIGVPIPERHEIFVGRHNIAIRIEELLRREHCPPILLYGQRRMGKTSLLRNLSRLLPSNVASFFADLQGRSSAAANDAGFLSGIGQDMLGSVGPRLRLELPRISVETLMDEPFIRFYEWLDLLGEKVRRHTILLALDELEALDRAFDEGRLSETRILGMLRHLIQHNPKLKLLMASSHSLEEMDRWYTYLINAQVLKIGYLKEEEAVHLIENPVKDFPLRYESEATQRILQLTRCHPALLQQLCKEIITIKNGQPPAERRLVRTSDVEMAAPDAVASIDMFFRDVFNQLPKESLALLRYMASLGERATVKKEHLVQKLDFDIEQAAMLPLRRDLLEVVNGDYRFQVELVRRRFSEDKHFKLRDFGG